MILQGFGDALKRKITWILHEWEVCAIAMGKIQSTRKMLAGFHSRHPYAIAKKKLPCLKRLPELTNEMVCILKDMQTLTVIYKLRVANLEFTLGLTENTDGQGKKVNDFFLPMSLRVEDSSVEKSNDGEVVDFIL